MISIWKLVDSSWELVEIVDNENNLISRLNELRLNNEELRAEKNISGFASILEV